MCAPSVDLTIIASLSNPVALYRPAALGCLVVLGYPGAQGCLVVPGRPVVPDRLPGKP